MVRLGGATTGFRDCFRGRARDYYIYILGEEGKADMAVASSHDFFRQIDCDKVNM